MQTFLVHLLVRAVLVFLLAYIMPGISIQGFLPALFVAMALAFLNEFVKPLVVLLTLPVTILTLGLFMLVINALMVLLASWIVAGFDVSGFWAALFFGLVLSLVQATFQVKVIKHNDRDQDFD